MKAFIYIRVSTEEQAVEGKSVETQERLGRDWAKKNDYQVVDIFKDEGKSGTNLNRPALQDMLSRVRNEDIDAVLVQDTDRLARNTLHHLTIKAELKKRKVKLVSISQPMLDDSPEGQAMDTFLAGMNTFASQITGRKTSKVLVEKAKIGWFPGGIPPLGYKNTDNPTPKGTLDKKIIVVDELIAIHIKKIFDMYATGKYNINQMTDYLNDQHIKPPHSTKVHASLVGRTLQNQFYIGKFLWKDQLYEGNHTPLISLPQFHKVQSVLTAHNQNATRTRKHNFVLRGYLWCADCEKRYWGEKHVKSNGSVYNHYYCSHCKRDTYVDKEKIENQVKKIFRKIQIKEVHRNTIIAKAKEILSTNRDNQDVNRKRLEIEKNKLVRAMHEAEDGRFVTHTLSEDAFQRMYPRFESELKIVDEAISKVGTDYSQNIHKLEKILKLAENIGESYKNAEDTLKKSYLNIFMQRFIVKDGKIISYTINPKIEPLLEKSSVRVRTTGLPR